MQILEHRHLNLANADRFVEGYCGLWRGGRNVMTLRATNNRFGLYDYRNIDIYYDAIPISENLVRVAGARSKASITKVLEDLRESTSPDSDLRELMAVLAESTVYSKKS